MQRLISTLASDSSTFFIHVDKKSNIENFSRLMSDNVVFTKLRVPVYWAEFSQVKAIVALIRTALAHPIKFDRFVLLSGADYPLRSLKYIEHFFEKNAEAEFINMIEMPAEAAGKPIKRLNTYVFPTDASILDKVLRKILVKIGAAPRVRDYKNFLGNNKPYGGSTWWALTREACETIVTFIDKQTRIVNFFKNTICPDESIFQTIIGNSHLSSKVSRNLTYADWSKGGASPLNISEAHLNFFRTTTLFPSSDVFGSGEMLFARKFQDNSEDIIMKLDKQIKEFDQ